MYIWIRCVLCMRSLHIILSIQYTWCLRPSEYVVMYVREIPNTFVVNTNIYHAWISKWIYTQVHKEGFPHTHVYI